MAVKVQAVVDLMIHEAKASGWKLGRSAAERALRLARRHGRLESPSKGWLIVSGAPEPAVAVDAPEPTPPHVSPKPATLTTTTHAVEIRATGPSSIVEAFDVFAGAAALGTVCISTDTMPAAIPTGVDHLRELLDERSAIMEFDGVLDRETADRLAAEMIMGRVCAAPAATHEVVAVDSQSLLARTHPLVDHSARLFGGTALLLSSASAKLQFSGAQTHQIPGVCAFCWESEWVDVPIHGGESTRVDCGHCGRFGWFSVWHGEKPQSPGRGRSLGRTTEKNHLFNPREESVVLHEGAVKKTRVVVPIMPAIGAVLMQESGDADINCTVCNSSIAQCN